MELEIFGFNQLVLAQARAFVAPVLLFAIGACLWTLSLFNHEYQRSQRIIGFVVLVVAALAAIQQKNFLLPVEGPNGFEQLWPGLLALGCTAAIITLGLLLYFDLERRRT